MTQAAMKIFDEIKTLTPDERAELIEMINGNYGNTADPDIEKAWIEEAEKRFDDYKKNGKGTCSEDEFFKIADRVHDR